MPGNKSIAVAAVLGAASVAVGQNVNDCFNLGWNNGINDAYNLVCNSALSAIVKKEPYYPQMIQSYVVGISNPVSGWWGCGEGDDR